MENVKSISHLSEDDIQLALNAKAERKARLVAVLPYAGLVFLIVFFSLTTQGKFLQASNLQVLVNQCFTLSITVMGGAFLYAIGGLDMAIGNVMAISTMVVLLGLRDLHLPLGVSLLLGLVTSIGCMSVTAIAKVKLRLPTFVASMCVLNITGGIIQSTVANNGEVVLEYSKYAYLNSWTLRGVVLVFVFTIGYILFNYTRFGKNLRFLGGNRKAAIISGVNEWWTTWFAYVAIAICLVIAGFFSVLRSGAVSASSGAGLNLTCMTAIVLGGFPLSGGTNCRYIAPVIGALTVTCLTNGLVLLGYADAMGYLIQGVLFLLVVGATYDRSKGRAIS